ncbi:MAG: peptidoglycan-binding protein LysM [Halioglobus sp.]
MGFFDFVTGGGDKPEDELTKTVEISQDRLDELRTKAIREKIAALPIDGEQIAVNVNGEIATLKGRAPTQEAMEKIVLCAGNQHGIGSVDCQIEVDEPAPAPAAEEAPAAEKAPAPAAEASAPTAAPAESAPTAQASTFYTVQSGDTLGAIAKAHYGDAGKYPLIFEANQPMLKDPDKIYPGQSLRIPPLT